MEGLLARGVRGLVDAQIITRSRAGVDALERMVASASTEVTAEVFQLRRPDLVDTFADAARRTGSVGILADPETIARSSGRKLRSTLERAGAAVVPYGSVPYKVHAKAASANRARAWVSTTTMTEHGREVLDLSAVFGGDAAASVAELARTAVAGGRSEQRAAARSAAGLGVLINDRAQGVFRLREQVETMLTGAREQLVIVTKAFNDEKLAHALVDARVRGVRIDLVTQAEKMSQRVRRILDAGGVTFRDDAYGATHANAVVADGSVAYFGSAHFTTRAMGRGSAYRSSRELGVVLTDRGAVDQVQDAILEVASMLESAS